MEFVKLLIHIPLIFGLIFGALNIAYKLGYAVHQLQTESKQND